MHAPLNGLTPVEFVNGVWLKRDDLFTVAWAIGGKARSCWALSQGAKGLVTASSRHSPQLGIVARVAYALKIRAVAYVPWAMSQTPEIEDAKRFGIAIETVRPGYNSVIIARARARAFFEGFTEVPFGMECGEAVRSTASQCKNLPWGKFERLVVPVGSGMSLAGILWGLAERKLSVPVLGVMMGADPTKRLNRWAPSRWREMVSLEASGKAYHDRVDAAWGGVRLDPVYEAKCVPWLRPGDLFWIVGIRP